MFCTKCGANNEDDAKICTACGADMEEEVQAEETVAEEVATEETTVEAAEAPMQEEAFEPVYEEPVKKKIKKGPVVAGIAAVILVILAVVGFAAKDTVMFNLSPKSYTADVIMNTFEAIGKQTEANADDIMGFDANSKDVTEKVYVSWKGDSPIASTTIDNIVVDAAFSTSLKDMEVKGNIDLQLNDNKYDLIEAVWNDDVIEYTSPALTDVDLSIPSKGFGKAFNESSWADSFGVEVEDNLDLSLSKWTGNGQGIDKETAENLKSEFKKFLESGEVANKGKGKVTIDGKEVNANKWDMIVTDDALAALLKAAAEVLKNSPTYAFAFNEYEMDEFIKACDELEFDDVIITMYSYKNMLVRAEVNAEEENVLYIQFNDTSDLLYSMELGIAMGGRNLVVRIENLSEGEDYIAFAITMAQVLDGTEFPMNNEALAGVEMPMGRIEMHFDFKDNNFGINMDVSGGGFDITGGCERTEEFFKFTIDDITVSEYGETISVMDIVGGELDIEYTVMPKADVTLDSLDGEVQNFLDMDETEAQELSTDMINKVSGIVAEYIDYSYYLGEYSYEEY